MNVITATAVILDLLSQAAALGNLLRTAQAEGRDISQAELDNLAQLDNVARDSLAAAITRARAQGR